MTEIDLDALEALAKAQLVQCGPCDFGLVEFGCTCPKGDPRPVISQLVEVIAELRRLQVDNANRILRHADAVDQFRAELRLLRDQLAEANDRAEAASNLNANAEHLLAEAKGRECSALCRDVEGDRDSLLPVVEAARAWRRWFPHADSMFAPENTLIGAVDAFEAEAA